MILDPVLASWLRDPLVNFHTWALNGVKGSFDKVYKDKTDYPGFFLQVINISLALTIGASVVLYLPAMGLSLVVLCGIAAVAAIVAYLLIGALLMEAGNGLIGFLASLGAGYLTFVLYTAAGLWFEWFGALVAAALVALATGFVIFPVAYLIIRLLTKRTLASWSGAALVKAHDYCFNEVSHAFSNTYSDKTSYRELFLHLANIGATFASFLLASWIAEGLELPLALSVFAQVVLTGVSYLLFFRLLEKAGSWLVSPVLGVALGVYTGAHVFAALSYNIWWNLAISAGVGVVALVAVFFIVYPLAYVLVKTLLLLVQASRWLQPVIAGVYNYLWDLFASIWKQFLEVYKGFSAWWTPFWAEIRRTWSDTWKSIKDSIGRKNG